MTGFLLDTVTILAALGAGLMAGTFFAFSAFVMAALGRIANPEGMRAMQSINVTVLNPWFFAAFFGTAVLSVVLLGAALFGAGGAAAAWLIAGSVLYLAGCIGVTVAGNVPLNNRLAAADADSADGAALWARYLRVWTAWNHVRTIACLAATAAFVLAVM